MSEGGVVPSTASNGRGTTPPARTSFEASPYCLRLRAIALALRATLSPARQPAGCRAALSQRERDRRPIFSRPL